MPEDAQLAEVFRWKHPIWWDPAPDWLWKRLEDRLDPKALVQLVAIQLEVQRASLAAQVTGIEQTIETLRKGLG